MTTQPTIVDLEIDLQKASFWRDYHAGTPLGMKYGYRCEELERQIAEYRAKDCSIVESMTRLLGLVGMV